MRARLHGKLLVSLAWCAGLALVVGLLVAGPLVLLWNGKARVATLQEEIDGKEESLRSHTFSPEYGASLQEMETALEGWRTMASSEALRLAELSAVARESGALIAGLQSVEQRAGADGHTVTCAYRLSLSGRYEQLASFCDRLYAARGLAAIDALEIESQDESERDVLQASVQVAWYAPGPSATDETERKLP